MKIRISLKSLVIFTCVLIVIVLGVICGFSEYKKSRPRKYTTVKIAQENEEEKESNTTIGETILKNKEKETEEYKKEERIYTEDWKRYMELSKSEREELDLIPRKYDVPIEKLEEIKKIEGIEDDNKDSESDSDDKKDGEAEIKDDKDKDNDNDNDNEEEDDDDDDDEEDDKKIEDEVIIPEKFNLNDKIDIKIENQGNYGLCWDFASMKALETHLALTEGKDYDFSEMHLDYMESKELYGSRDLHDGGSFEVFEAYNLKGGEVLEEDVPFREFSKSEYEKFPEMQSVINVTETVNFPSICKDNMHYYTDEQISDFRKCVKKHIMTYGAVTTGVYHSYEKCSYLPPSEEVWPDHLVTIVGWDDNYPKENFNGAQPQNNGAYLILNSWGPKANDNGYYYISYEDKYVENFISGIISTKLDSAYKISELKDSDIKDYIIKSLGHLIITRDGEEYITKSALNQVHTLDLSNKSISTLDGIELFSNARIIDLSNNNISDLKPLKKLKNNAVTSLNLSNNKITNLSGLDKIKQLEELNLSNNDFKDISKLKNISNLRVLNVSGCNLNDFSCYDGFTSLEHIIASETQNIINFDKIPNSVDKLTLNDCGIEDIDELIGDKVIHYLYIANNNIKSISNIEHLKNLKIIDISNNPIIDWSWIGKINGASLIRAQNCNIEDITILDTLYQSVWLVDFSNNKISDVSKLVNLDRLIMNLDLSNNGKITGLEGLNSISSITLKDCEIDGSELNKLTNVSELNLDNCKIDDLSAISNLTKLLSLSLENCNVTDLETINKLKNLDILNLNSNKGLSGKITLQNLSELYLANCDIIDDSIFNKCNSIVYLDISNNPNFNKLYDILEKGEIIVRIDAISAEELEKAEKKSLLWGLENVVIEGEVTVDNNQIDLRNNQALKKYIMRNWGYPFDMENGVFLKNKTLINILDTNQKNVFLKVNGTINYFSQMNGINIKYSIEKRNKKNTSTNQIIDNEINELNEDDEINYVEDEFNEDKEENILNNETNSINAYSDNTISNRIPENVVTNVLIENATSNNVI